jgi:ATP-dependent Clp protease adaptor protein ClpS
MNMNCIFRGTTQPTPQIDVDVLTEELTEPVKALIVYNDDYNTFDHVINTLVKVCEHQTEQAEQCAWIIHYNGKCDVMHGTFEELRPRCEAILERGITAKIEE